MASAAQIKAFIAEIGPVIKAVATEKGYKFPSAIIAQACVESAYNTSTLSKKYHNYFGMKCGSKWTGKSVNLSTQEEYSAGTKTTIKDNFRVYDSMEAGVRGYFDFISSSRYANLKNATGSKNYLELIKADGYATSSTYVSTVYSVVTKYGLASYDNNASSSAKQYKLSGNLYYRNGPGTSYHANGVLTAGSIVTVTKTTSNNWGYVEGKGWISLSTKYTKQV